MKRSSLVTALVAVLTLTLAFALPIAAAEAPIVTVTNNAQLGNILTDAKGMTLYIFTKDTPNESVCYDQCAQKWPPLLTTDDQIATPSGLSGTLGVTTRKDGTKQVTFNQQPLYYWFQDAKAGDTSGQGVGGVWFVVQAQMTPATLPKAGEAPLALYLAAALGLLAVGGGATYLARVRAR